MGLGYPYTLGLPSPGIALASPGLFLGQPQQETQDWQARVQKGKMTPKNRILQCSQFCMEQAALCLLMAKLNNSPSHHRIFMRLAAQWDQIAKECGKVEPVLWPPEFKTENMIYPCADAR